MDGLQVAPQTAEKASKPLPEALLRDETAYVASRQEGETSGGMTKPTRRICGLSPRLFWVIIAVALVVAIVAGVVGGVVGSKAKKSRRNGAHTSPGHTGVSGTSATPSGALTTITEIASFADQPGTKTVVTTLTTTIPSVLPPGFSTKTLSGPLPTGRSECPNANETIYNFHKGFGQTFKKYCNSTTPLAPYGSHNTQPTMNDCIDACAADNTPGNITCLAVSYKYGPPFEVVCNLFHGVGKLLKDSPYEVALLVTFEP